LRPFRILSLRKLRDAGSDQSLAGPECQLTD